ncbi:MAG: hypothetical protein AB1478_07370 [Nitrospirota bacterium]
MKEKCRLIEQGFPPGSCGHGIGAKESLPVEYPLYDIISAD